MIQEGASTISVLNQSNSTTNLITPIQIIAEVTTPPDYSPSKVKELMERFDMNERGFSLLMNVTPMTVRLWTSGAVSPCGLSRRLMQIYAACPEVINKVLSSERGI